MPRTPFAAGIAGTAGHAIEESAMSPETPVAERDVFAQRLRIVLDRLADTVEAIPAAHVDDRILADGNTPAIIVAHVSGSVRASVLGIGCGVPVERSRVDEFAAVGGTPTSLGAAFRELADEAERALRATRDGQFDEVTTPPQAWLGLVPQQPMAGRAAILSAIAHASEHLGELMFMKDTFALRDS
jgi:hypothetical protein